jgi:phosphatidylinositol alpha-1,6-mannosyltransferase
VLGISRLVPRKGFDVLIDAVNRLSDRVNLRLDILTDGVKPEWESERVRIHPSVTEEEKSRYFAEATVFVLANRHIGSDFEGFGYVVLEAMAHGLPCVVGRAGGPAELIRHGQDGFVVDADSVDELCSALETLCADAGLRDRMGRSARQHANDRFSEEAFQNRMLEVLTE